MKGCWNIVLVLAVGGCSGSERQTEPAEASGAAGVGAAPGTAEAVAGAVSSAPSSDLQTPGASASDPWQQALLAIRRLPPDSFPGVPGLVREALAAADCRVPQSFYPDRAHNVVSGSFAAPGQTDWAALCVGGEPSPGDSSRIFVVWGGPVRCESEVAWADDAMFLQVIGNDQIGYSRSIDAVDIEFILARVEAYGGPAPPSTDHGGINDAFLEKASTVRFCHDGAWIELQGVD